MAFNQYIRNGMHVNSDGEPIDGGIAGRRVCVTIEDQRDGAPNHEDFKSAIEQALNIWAGVFAELWPGLTVRMESAEDTEGFSFGGEEQGTSVAAMNGVSYDLPHEEALGDFRFGMVRIDGLKNAIAVAHYPGGRLGVKGNVGGDMFFDSSEYWRKDTDPDDGKSHSVLFIAIHEIGHCLGLGHNESTDSVMYYRGPPGRDWIRTFGSNMPQTDKDCLKALYEGGTTPSNCGDSGSPWPSLVVAVVLAINGATVSSRIWYSLIQEGTVTDVGNISCCVCCDPEHTRDKGWPPTDPVFPNDCFCGCCPCIPEGNLRFRMTECKVNPMEEFQENPEDPDNYTEDCKVCDKWGVGNDTYLELERTGLHCFETYWWSLQNDIPGEEVLDDRVCPIDWEQAAEFEQGIAYKDTPSDHEYNPSKGHLLDAYKESWGYSGVVCAHEPGSDDEPCRKVTADGWYNEKEEGTEMECEGMGIVASLCCCRTGKYLDDIPEWTRPQHPCGIAGLDYWDSDDPLSKTRCPAHTRAEKGDIIWPGAALDELPCQLPCISFTIVPAAFIKNSHASSNVDWGHYEWDPLWPAPEEVPAYTPCSPCVRHIGPSLEKVCNPNGYGGTNTWSPSLEECMWCDTADGYIWNEAFKLCMKGSSSQVGVTGDKPIVLPPADPAYQDVIWTPWNYTFENRSCDRQGGGDGNPSNRCWDNGGYLAPHWPSKPEGGNRLLGGQCAGGIVGGPDGPTDQKFIVEVEGGFTMNCDCEIGNKLDVTRQGSNMPPGSNMSDLASVHVKWKGVIEQMPEQAIEHIDGDFISFTPNPVYEAIKK